MGRRKADASAGRAAASGEEKKELGRFAALTLGEREREGKRESNSAEDGRRTESKSMEAPEAVGSKLKCMKSDRKRGECSLK